MLYKYTTMTTEKWSFVTQYLICDLCDYKCTKKSVFNKHKMTRKHQNKANTTELQQKITQNVPQVCECGKEYTHRGSLYNHKKKCTFEENSKKEETKIIINESNQDFKQMFLQAMEKNNELVKTITELAPKIGNNNNNTNIKQKFNINVFLNEKCKDAISMDQFIDKIEISMKNLLTTKDKGLGEGLTNIIIDNMNKLSVYERPMHCTDKKRETLYIKNSEWEKDEKKEQINEILNKVEKKQMKNIDKWTKEHPNYKYDESLQEEYVNLVKSCTSSIDNCKEKVIKKVCDIIHVPE